jgi:hypothetical protein
MKVEVLESAIVGRYDLLLGGIRYSSFSEHDLRDIVFVLEQRRAMSKRCTATSGEHTCSLWPGHSDTFRTSVSQHLCRGCSFKWEGEREDA